MTHAEAVEFFSDLYRGSHHIPGSKYKGENVKPYGHGWTITTHEDLSSFDWDILTRLVLMAHDRAVRVEVSPAMRYLRISIWQRVRDESTMTGHPTIETAIAGHRATYAGRPEQVKP
jgi:hypothetical protein